MQIGSFLRHETEGLITVQVQVRIEHKKCKSRLSPCYCCRVFVMFTVVTTCTVNFQELVILQKMKLYFFM